MVLCLLFFKEKICCDFFLLCSIRFTLMNTLLKEMTLCKPILYQLSLSAIDGTQDLAVLLHRLASSLLSLHYYVWPDVFVTFLLLWENTMTKATYQRKALFGLMVPEGLKSITIMARKYGSRQVWIMRELLFATLKSELELAHELETSKSSPCDILQ